MRKDRAGIMCATWPSAMERIEVAGERVGESTAGRADVGGGARRDMPIRKWTGGSMPVPIRCTYGSVPFLLSGAARLLWRAESDDSEKLRVNGIRAAARGSIGKRGDAPGPRFLDGLQRRVRRGKWLSWRSAKAQNVDGDAQTDD